jgi:hypothetical protein
VRHSESRQPTKAIMTTKVLVCKTDRIVYDPIDREVQLESFMQNGRLIVKTPRNPYGIDPGVTCNGIPVIARKEMLRSPNR